MFAPYYNLNQLEKEKTRDYEDKHLMKANRSIINQDGTSECMEIHTNVIYQTMYMNDEKSWMESRLQPGT